MRRQFKMIFHKPHRILVVSSTVLAVVGGILWLPDQQPFALRLIGGFVLTMAILVLSVAASYYWIRTKRKELE